MKIQISLRSVCIVAFLSLGRAAVFLVPLGDATALILLRQVWPTFDLLQEFCPLWRPRPLRNSAVIGLFVFSNARLRAGFLHRLHSKAKLITLNQGLYISIRRLFQMLGPLDCLVWILVLILWLPYWSTILFILSWYLSVHRILSNCWIIFMQKLWCRFLIEWTICQRVCIQHIYEYYYKSLNYFKFYLNSLIIQQFIYSLYL